MSRFSDLCAPYLRQEIISEDEATEHGFDRPHHFGEIQEAELRISVGSPCCINLCS